MNVTRLSTLAAALALAGCAVGPDYHRPAPLPAQATPKSFATDGTNAVAWKVAQPSANQPRGAWWRIFGDAELSRLESLALTNNQNIAAAVSRLEEARQLTAAARSEFYPQLNAGGTPGGDASRQRTSVNQPLAGQPAGVSHTYDTFTAPIYLGWELDLWGRVRRQTEAARERFTASADDLESARLEVAAGVAADYFALRTLDDEFALITNTIEAYRRSLELTQNRRRGGIVSDLDVAQAAAQLHSAEVRLPDLRLRRAQTLHALAVLCGESPVNFTAAASRETAAAIPQIPLGLPSELLEHRPDIAAAERRMAAANADVGVAKSAFFPAIKFNGVAGLQSVSAGSLFDWPSRFWSVGPNIDLPLFTGGLNTASLARSRAAYNESVATYRQMVLGAFGEVQDSLAAQSWLADESDAENQAVEAARRALDLANNRYRAGLITYLDVATAQTAALNEERNAVELQGARLTACVNFVKALGGGWLRPNN
jgi:multidrug efflux system outer membrane protein